MLDVEQEGTAARPAAPLRPSPPGGDQSIATAIGPVSPAQVLEFLAAIGRAQARGRENHLGERRASRRPKTRTRERKNACRSTRQRRLKHAAIELGWLRRPASAVEESDGFSRAGLGIRLPSRSARPCCGDPRRTRFQRSFVVIGSWQRLGYRPSRRQPWSAGPPGHHRVGRGLSLGPGAVASESRQRQTHTARSRRLQAIASGAAGIRWATGIGELHPRRTAGPRRELVVAWLGWLRRAAAQERAASAASPGALVVSRVSHGLVENKYYLALPVVAPFIGRPNGGQVHLSSTGLPPAAKPSFIDQPGSPGTAPYQGRLLGRSHLPAWSDTGGWSLDERQRISLPESGQPSQMARPKRASARSVVVDSVSRGSTAAPISSIADLVRRPEGAVAAGSQQV